MEKLKFKLELVDFRNLKFNEGQIKGLPKNPRIFDDNKVAKLMKSIQEDGEMLKLRELVAYDNHGELVVIGGNMRLTAIQKLYDKKDCVNIPVKVLDSKTPVEFLKSFVIKDNNSYGEWDYDLLQEDWNTEDLNAWGLELEDVKMESPDEVDKLAEDGYEPEVKEEARTKYGDVIQLGNHRLMCGDATKEKEVLKLMGGAKANLYLTDPPYNVNYQGGTSEHLKIQNDNMNNTMFEEFIKNSYQAADVVMNPGAAFYIFHADSNSLYFRRAADEIGWKIRECIIWVKNSLVLGRQDYQWMHEPCLYGWKEGTHYFIDDRSQTTVIDSEQFDFSKKSKSELVQLLNEIYSDTINKTIIREHKPQKNDLHPTMKPIKLFGKLISNSTKVGGNVLDTFAGSGTSIIACEQLNRKCFAMELDPSYCDVIVDRYEQYSGIKAIYHGK